MSTISCPHSASFRSLRSGTAWPRWRFGCVGSKPCLMRSGRSPARRLAARSSRTITSAIPRVRNSSSSASLGRVGTTQRISAELRLYDGGIARSKTTRDHALGRGPYRQLRRRNGGGIRGRLAVVPSVVLALVIAGLALAAFGAVTAFAFFSSDLPSPEELARDPLAQSTKVYDRDGQTLLYQFEVERREVIPLDDVPQLLIDATIAAEDKSFWTNPGIDVFALARALRDDLLQRDVVSG